MARAKYNQKKEKLKPDLNFSFLIAINILYEINEAKKNNIASKSGISFSSPEKKLPSLPKPKAAKTGQIK